MVKVAEQAVQFDEVVVEPLLAVFKDDSAEADLEKCAVVGRKLVCKVLHAIAQEVIDVQEQLQVTGAGGMTTSGLNLRDRIHLNNA